MKPKVIFEDIEQNIINELELATSTIYIAVAWFTNLNLFKVLLDKAKENCKIYLIINDDEINNNSSLNFQELLKFNSTVYKVLKGADKIMHHKFCVIDSKTTITGSYNWSYAARTHHENILIFKENKETAEQFIEEFNNLTRCAF